jgi:hypothetical protein
MKVIFLILSFIFTFFPYNEKLDNCNGIDRFVFGTPKEQFKNMTLELEQGNAQLYTMNPEVLKLPGVQIEDLRISFIKNKLSAISLTTKNASGAGLFKYLKETYGTPTKNKNQFEWIGKQASIVFELYKNNKDAAVDVYSK